MTCDNLESPAALGQWARRARKAQGLTLKALGDRAGLGIRFLSEFERGKETAELGKALTALTALGLKVILAPDAGPAQDSAGENAMTAPEPSPLAETRGAAAPRTMPAAERGSRPAAGGDAARLWDMLAAAIDARELMDGCDTEPALHQSTALKRALERCFDVLGEAARRVTPQCQKSFPDLPWREMITRRNSLVLDYEQVDHGALYRVARADLPGLETKLLAVLAALAAPVTGRNPIP